MTVAEDLETRIRERAVRVRERLALLGRLTEDGGTGEEQIRRRIAEIERRIRQTAETVRSALR
jgi:hypothetical protein